MSQLETLLVESVHWSEFSVEDRTRVQLGEPNTEHSIQVFATKLRDEGQQNPITYEWIDGKRRVNTGGRRYAAAMWLESKNEFIGMGKLEGSPLRVAALGHVLARDIGTLDDIERLILELSENINRKGFTKPEEALGFAKLQKLMEERDGRKVDVTELSEVLKVSRGQVGMALRVAQHINEDPKSQLSRKLIKASSIKAANDQLSTHKKLTELKRRIAASKPTDDYEKALGHADGLKFLQELPDESVDFFNFDPPWGVGIDDYDRRKKHESFDDSSTYAWDEVIYPIIPELFRVLKSDTWGVVWYGAQHYQKIVTALETLSGKVKSTKGFDVTPVPYIWYKTNKGGSQNNPDLVEMNVYETYLRVAKGDPRLFKKPCKNVIECPMDYSDRDHFAQKPVELMVEILERYTFGAMHVIDPTYGSGRIFKACKKLGRAFSGAEKSPGNREKALLFMRTVE